LQVLLRAAALTSASLGFATRLLLDKQFGSTKANEEARARELTELITELGPTFIKIGQALSIRADLLPPAYLLALTELQDRVPPVPTEQADQILEQELGQAVGEMFEEITPEPIASASLGQVYRARLRDGPEVAVKVQRPGMEEVISLDLFLLRTGAGPLEKVQSLLSPTNTDLVGLVDTWGEGFVAELDYRQEATNAEEFQAAISETPLGDAVFAPPVVRAYSTTRVLTTEWILGERLEQSTSTDITKLCSMAMNTYLTMLLGTGVLHADPHPGNLLRTPDGRLCILDWGLVTSMDKDLQYTFIEHIAHLVTRDYAMVPGDLVKLGFVPEGKEAEIEESEVVEVLASVYGQWTDGGGAAGIDVNRFLSELQGLGDRYGNIFRVPSYFFYIARAFAVLEGIGLSNSPGYSIVGECLPYISQRLLTDPSPRAAGALATYVYGEDKESPDRQVSVGKVEYLAEGFSSYSASTGGLASKSPALEAGQVVEQLAELLIGDGGEQGSPTPLQDIVVDELAKVLGAGGRTSLASLGLVPGPSETAAVGGPGWSALAPDQTDAQALDGAQRLIRLAEPRVREAIDSFRALEREEQLHVAREVLAKLWEYRGGALKAGERLAKKFVAQSLRRISQGLASL